MLHTCGKSRSVVNVGRFTKWAIRSTDVMMVTANDDRGLQWEKRQLNVACKDSLEVTKEVHLLSNRNGSHCP